MNQDNGDKRKVSTDALETLGTIIDENEKRDAIHLAVIPMQANEVLIPGMHVDKNGCMAESQEIEGVGIVDPFLMDCVMPGEWFWLVIYPRKINSLRHVWSHPAFPDEEGTPNPIKTELSIKEKSEAWIRNYADEIGSNYKELMEGASDWVCKGEFLYGEPDEDGMRYRFEDKFLDPEFWEHYENVTGTKVEDRDDFFSCSC
jgi:hypothetical protein